MIFSANKGLTHKITIQLQIEQEISLFYMLEHF